MPGPTPSQPGWYDDGDGHERWYDGNAWTDHVRGPSHAAAGEAPASDDATVVVPTAGAGQPAADPQADPAADSPNGPPTGALPPPPPGPAPTQLQVGGGKGVRIAIAVLGVLVLLAIAVVGVLVLLGNDDDKKDVSDEPTTPSPTQTTSEAPSSELDVPTIDPSDFPTEVPSEVPSLPSVPDLPTGLPTGFPTDFPSDLPTDPSGWESWFSDQLEQANP